MGLKRFKSKIAGFVLVLCMLVSAYTVIVEAVQQFDNISLITQLSLFGANDAVLDKPASDLGVNWSLNGTSQSPVQTDSTGCANLVFPVGNPLTGLIGVYNVTASYPGDNATYQPANVSWIYDYRWPSSMACYEGNATNATSGGTLLQFRLCSYALLNMSLSGMAVRFYVDGVLESGGGTTNSTGGVSFSYGFNKSRTYVVTASFAGTSAFNPCNVSVAVTIVPLAVEFSVSPSEFAAGTYVTLNATVMDLRYDSVRYTNSDCSVQFYQVDANNQNTSLGSPVPTVGGVATRTVQYPTGGVAHAYKAIAKLTGGTIQVMSNPVQLTVGCNTTLLLNVTRDFSSTRHSFMFRLLSGGSPVCRRNITLTLNSTVYSSKQYGSLRTNNAGYA